MKKYKSTVIELLNGRKKRIIKADVQAIHEQLNIDGSVDVGVFMKSGEEYWVDTSKEQVEDKIFN